MFTLKKLARKGLSMRQLFDDITKGHLSQN